jgi:hypothetical protein
VLTLALLAVAACEGEERAPVVPIDASERGCTGASETIEVAEEQMPEISCPDGERQLLCFGSWAARCGADGDLQDVVNCRESDQVCATKKCDDDGDCTGCRDCVPGSVRCGEDGERLECNAEGTDYEVAEVCDEAAGLRCSLTSGQCEDLCAAAEQAQSYIGCDYWAVATRNSQLAFDSQTPDGLCQPFPFAVVVANPQGVPARVTVHSPGLEPETHTIEPSGVETIFLPCSLELKGEPFEPGEEAMSVRSTEAAHHIVSDVPVTVYQFNPLEFESEWTVDDPAEGIDAGDSVYSHTNDASLLLPTHSLTGNYVVMAQPTLLHQVNPRDEQQDVVRRSGPGFVAITGVESEPVEVELTASAFTMPTRDGSIPALSPGETHTLTLAPGEVVQIVSAIPDDCDGEPEDNVPGGTLTYCKVGRSHDLTGTRIRATGKVSVLGGHDCVFLPHNRWACDHIEETMFPIEAWGREILVSVSEAVACQPEVPNMVRVLSATDGNRVNFVPEVREPVVLDAGDVVEVIVTEDFRVTADDAIMVAQFLLGQDYEGRGSAGSFGKGDPAMSLGIPFEQWRNHYAFLTPETFPDNFVNIIAGEGQLVLLDGRVVSGFTPIEGTRTQVARVAVGGGQHRVTSAENFGIVVYGYALYTSYMVPGGLDLNRINRPD